MPAGPACPAPPGSSSHPVPGTARLPGSPGARSRARSAWLARLTHCPTAVNRSFPAAVHAHPRDRDQAGQRVDPPLRRTRVRQRFQPLPRTSCQVRTVRAGLDYTRPRARQCHRGHAAPRSRRPRDLHDHRSVPAPTTVRARLVSHIPGQSTSSPEHAGALAASAQQRTGHHHRDTSYHPGIEQQPPKITQARRM